MNPPNYDQVYAACQQGDLKALQRWFPGNPTQWRSPWGLSLLHMVVHTPHVPVLDWLLTFSFDVNGRTLDGDTPLMWACGYTREDMTRRLLNSGAHVQATDPGGRTALHVACARTWLEGATVLLEYGAPVNAKDLDGQTALHVACSRTWLKGVPVLLEQGADPEVRDHQGRLPKDALSVFSPHYATLCFLLDTGRHGCGLK
jgi:ankyrin repeat protein